MADVFKWLYFAGFPAQIILRAPHAIRRRRLTVAEQHDTPAESLALAALYVGNLALPLAFSFTGRLRWADYGWSPTTRRRAGLLGSAFLAASLWLFWRSHRDLGESWFPALALGAEHRLVTHGIYSYLRHPMYTSQLLWGVAQALLLPNWLAGPAGLLAFLILYLVRVSPEERMLLERFGDEYRAYRARTGGVIPRLRG